jgi:hypothetical protein
MKKISILLIFVAVYHIALAQVANEIHEPDLVKLELTSSPAYVLLGVQPTNIIRPSTPRDFAAGLQYFNINGVIQPGFAMEVNPFNWGKKEVENNSSSFVANDFFDKRAWPAIKKNFSLSIATSSTDTAIFGNLQKGTGVGFGIRATIVPGTVHKPTYDNFYAWALGESKLAFLTYLSFYIQDLKSDDDPEKAISRAMDGAEVWLSNTSHIPGEMKTKILEELDIYKKGFSKYTTKQQLDPVLANTGDAEMSIIRDQNNKAAIAIDNMKMPFARDGFILEFAFSGLVVMQQNTWDSLVYAKSGVWLTPSYRLDLSSSQKPGTIQSLDFLGIIRYLYNEERVDEGNYADIGLKLQFNRNSWNSSAEGVMRHASVVPDGIDNKWTYSWIFNFSYLITEDISFRFSFGSNFNGNTTTFTEPNAIILMGGLNFGILK